MGNKKKEQQNSLELATATLLYMAIKTPYNTISSDKDYNKAMKILLCLCENNEIQFALDDDEGNLIHHDINQLIKNIKENNNEIYEVEDYD